MATGRSAKLDKVLAGLPPEKARRVHTIVNRYLRACDDYGVKPDDVERVYQEAMQMAEIEARFPSPAVVQHFGAEPIYRYEQYVTPTDKDF